jgi:hypothetical protein
MGANCGIFQRFNRRNELTAELYRINGCVGVVKNVTMDFR